MNIQATSVSTQLYHFLETFASTGTVHSVYRKTINLSFDDHITAIQCACTPFSPVTIQTSLSESEMLHFDITAGLPVCLTKEQDRILIHIKDHITIVLYRNTAKDAALRSSLEEHSLRQLLEHCQMALSMHPHESFDSIITQSSVPANDSLLLSAIRHMLSEISNAYQAHDYLETALLFCRLIGLGSGLTPAGDDFLCGVLAACRLCDTAPATFTSILQSSLSEKLHNIPECTNVISRTFLQCALQGLFSDAVLQLSSIPSKERIAAGFSAIGHSSGYDTLSGIVFMLNQFLMDT